MHVKSNTASKDARKMRRVRPKFKKWEKFRLDSNDFGFICAGVSNVGGYKTPDLIWVVG